jgi:hypothetical protein
MLIAFTSLPGFVTLVFRGMPTVVRWGPNCSPKTRSSPGATGVWSSATAVSAISCQYRSRRVASALEPISIGQIADT